MDVQRLVDGGSSIKVPYPPAPLATTTAEATATTIKSEIEMTGSLPNCGRQIPRRRVREGLKQRIREEMRKRIEQAGSY